MSEDYRKGYRDGFKDGYEQAKKEHVWLTPTMPYQGDTMKCPICGRIGVHASVCYHPQCPTKVTAVGEIKINTLSSTGTTNVPMGGTATSLGESIGATGTTKQHYDFDNYEMGT